MPEVFNLMDHFVKKAKTHQLLEDSILFSFLGRRRSGKSTLTLAVLKKIDPDMTTEQVVFTNKDFREATREYKEAAIFWDEPSVTAYSREYQEEANRLLNKTLQVFGYRKLVIGLAYQHADFLDKHTRWLVDVYFLCSSSINVDKLSRQNYVEPKVLVTDWVRDPYLAPYKYNRNGRFVEMGKIPVPDLDELFKWAGMKKSFFKDYQRKKDEFFESAEWEKENKREEDKLGIDRRQLRRFAKYEKALFNCIDYLVNQGVQKREIAKLCGTTLTGLRYWLDNPVFSEKQINIINNILNQPIEGEAEFQD